uniref:Uncharacterized protein n=1 Tax=Sphaerodactylus townsendi TaxID=933632 RepID=A0ACB8FG26_9SAUR
MTAFGTLVPSGKGLNVMVATRPILSESNCPGLLQTGQESIPTLQAHAVRGSYSKKVIKTLHLMHLLCITLAGSLPKLTGQGSQPVERLKGRGKGDSENG